MAKAKLEFNLDDVYEQRAFRRASNATNAYLAFHEIGNEIFRPARKHGYHETSIREAIEKKDVEEVIFLLEEKFYKILEENRVNMEDLE